MAGLIPQSFIDELLNRVDIVDVIGRRVTLKKAGKNHVACCPFHQEKTPSFSVQPEKQFFYCFGCGAGGNAIGFVQKFHGIGFPEAVELIARDAGLEAPRQESRGETRGSAERKGLYECLEQASKYFQRQLRRHASRRRAVDWCKSRGISGTTAREFQLGYAPPGWENLLGELGTDEASRNALLKAGLAIARDAAKERKGDSGKSSLYDRFRDRVVFPIRDSRGRTVGFGGRVLDDATPKYLNSPETPVFQKGRELYGLFEARREKAGKFLLVEGYMDVIALAEAGIRNALATLGTATSPFQLQRMFRQTSEIVFCFDGDEAGGRAAWRALETVLPLMADGKSARFLFLPEGEDPDSMVRKLGAAEFLKLVDEAQPLETFFFDHLSENLDLKAIEGRASLSSKALPLVRKLPAGVYRQLMLDRLAELTGVDSKTLLSQPGERPDRGEQARNAEPPPYGMAPPPRDYPPQRQGEDWQTRTPRPHNSGLVVVKLLLRASRIALAAKVDLAPLRDAGDDAGKLAVEIIEKVRSEPDIAYYTLLEVCYGKTSIRGQLTTVMTAESIEPLEHRKLELEFLQILERLVARSASKLSSDELRHKLRARTAAKHDSGR